MSTIDYKALAERVAQRAIYADNNADPNNKAWAADLRAVVSLLNGMADAQPVAWRCEVRDLLTQAEQCLSTAVQFEQWAHDEPPSYLSAWDYEADHIAAEIRAMLAAAPAAPQAEPKREPLSDERINEIGEPFGYFTYGDAQGDKRRVFVRAIESSHGIGYGKAIEGGPSELRSCTCHPDDNPPVPCAQKYALNECRATRSGPDEAQIEARDALLDFISENGTASEGVQHYLDRYVRAALAAKDNGNAGE